VDRFDGTDETEERATNGKLYKKLFDRAVEQARKAAATKDSKKDKREATGAKREPTAAEKKARAEERRRQLDRNLAAWRTDWLRMLVAPRLNFSREAQVSNKLLLWLATNGDQWRSDRREVLDRVLGVAKHSGGKAAWTKLHNSDDAGQVHDWLLALCRGLFWDDAKNEARQEIDADIVEDLSAELEIDLAAAWEANDPDGKHQACAGPLTRRLYELHQLDELQDLAKGLGVETHGLGKTQLVDRLVGAPSLRRLALPKCIRPVKGPKAQGKKMAGKKKGARCTS
jgi:hypothetical protein